MKARRGYFTAELVLSQMDNSPMNPSPEKAQATVTRNQEAAITPDVIGSVVNVIVQHCDPERIILFGSAATERAHQGSDLDLLVVMDSSLPRHKRAAPIRLLFSPYPCPMDILVYTPTEIGKWRGTTNHIVTEVFDRGKVVYERAG